MHHREGRNGRFLHTGLVLALSAGTALAQQNAVNFADMVVGPRGEVDVVKPGPIPLSKELGVNMPGVLPTVTLAGVENQMLLAEDAAVADASMPLRIGVGRAAEVNAGDGVWLQPRGKGQGDGRLWVCDIQSPSATAIRVHLTGMGIPEGGMLRVYSPEHPDAVTEYRGSGQYGDGDQYTFPTEGDTVRLEYFAPPAEEMNEALPFAIDSVQHYYRAMREIAGGYGEREGTCHNDVTCYPAYATSAKAVGKLTFVQGGSSYLCTGQLMATTAGDYTPWLSTAITASARTRWPTRWWCIGSTKRRCATAGHRGAVPRAAARACSSRTAPGTSRC